MRLAVTVQDPKTGLYPPQSAKPNTYWIAFADGEFTEEPGRKPQTLKIRQCPDRARKTAHNLVDSKEAYVPEGTAIAVFFHNGRWWFEWWGKGYPAAYYPDCGSSSGSEESGSYSSSSGFSSGSEGSGLPSGSSGSEGSGFPSGSSGSGGSGFPSGSSGSEGSGLSSGSSGSEESLTSSESGSGIPGESGSAKNPAVLPASWTRGGYTEVYTEESDRVWLNHRMRIVVTNGVADVPIDFRYLEICEPKTIECWGDTVDCACDRSVNVFGESIRVRVSTLEPVTVRVFLSGIRRGFINDQFPDRDRSYFEANEAFLKQRMPK